LVHERIRRLGLRGVGLAELIVVVAILGLLAAVGVPYLVSYWQASTLTAGAQELQTILNGARQLAIRNNTSVCVKRNTTSVQYITNGCGGTVWTGAGSDNAGWIPLVNGITITAGPAPDVIFTYLGAAAPGGTYTVKAPSNAQTVTVTVAGSGRVTIP
jgi:type II secretory pathway pseudopilin PulG